MDVKVAPTGEEASRHEPIAPIGSHEILQAYLIFLDTFGHSNAQSNIEWGEAFTCGRCNEDEDKPLSRIPIERGITPDGRQLGERYSELGIKPGKVMPIWEVFRDRLVVQNDNNLFSCYCPGCRETIRDAALFHTFRDFRDGVIYQPGHNPKIFLVSHMDKPLVVDTGFNIDIDMFAGASIESARTLARRVVRNYFGVRTDQQHHTEQLIHNMEVKGVPDTFLWYGEIGSPPSLRSGATTSLKLSERILSWGEEQFRSLQIPPKQRTVLLYTHSSSVPAGLFTGGYLGGDVIFVDPRSFSRPPNERRGIIILLDFNKLQERLRYTNRGRLLWELKTSRRGGVPGAIVAQQLAESRNNL